MKKYKVQLKNEEHTFSVLRQKVKNADNFFGRFENKNVEKLFEYLEDNYLDYQITEIK
jgi:hypothetical protein